MKEYPTADLRNVALVGHGSCGKTMLSEAMLATVGTIGRLGSVSGGTTVSDFHEDEKKRGISIQTSLLHVERKNKKLNILDTPGYADLVGEVLGALRVSDLAAVVVNAGQGIEVGTEQVWDYADADELPKMVVLNALDKENVSYESVVEKLRETFGNRIFPVTVPVDAGPGFHQVVDIVRQEILTFDEEAKGTCKNEPVTGDWKDRCTELHEQFIEFVAESDDALLEKFFEEGSLSEEEMLAGIHDAIVGGTLIPLFSVSAETNVGIAPMLDFVAQYGPTPEDRTVKALRNDEEFQLAPSEEETVAYVFKSMSEAHVGEYSIFRVFAGKVETGSSLENSETKTSEKIGQLYVLNGKERTQVKTLHAGDIGGVLKLKDTRTGHCLCSPRRPVSLPPVDYPQPNIHASIRARSKGDEEKMSVGLSTIRAEDPALLYRQDPELKQTILSGQGELHLQITAERLKQRFGVEVDLTQPRIPYRETITAKADSKYRHKKQTGGAGQFAEVWMRIEPTPRSNGVEFTQSLVGQNVDRVFVPSVEKGVNAACTEGILIGCKVVDVKIDFYDGKMHPVDSKDIAFQIAGKMAFREAFQNAKPRLLEPISNVEIRVPQDYMGAVMGEISTRRGRIQGMDAVGKHQVIRAQAPQAELHSFSTTLRSLTGGRGVYTETFSHYEEMPRENEAKVIEETRRRKEEAS